MNGLGYDLSFELNNFSKPKVISITEMAKNIVTFILFGKPGQYPSIPSIGLDIESYLYSHKDSLDLNALKQKIIAQCSILDEFFTEEYIDLKIENNAKGQPELKIKIKYAPNEIRRQKTETFQIGITYDDLNKMIYEIYQEE